MFKKISIWLFIISIGYYFFFYEENFPVAGTNHIMSVDMYNGADVDDCITNPRTCSTVSSLLPPHGVMKALAGDNTAYLKAMAGEIDSFIFGKHSCEVLQHKEMDNGVGRENVRTHLMALRCTALP